MNHFYILRNNQESGPFTLKELRATGLFASDLVWQDGESTCWKYPQEIDELEGLIKAAPPKVQEPAKTRAVPIAVDSTRYAEKPAAIHISTAFAASKQKPFYREDEILSAPSFEALKRKQARISRRRAWKQPVNIAANLFGLAIMVIGVMMAAVMVKKAVDSIAMEEPDETAEARVIDTGNLRPSHSAHAALAPADKPKAAIPAPAPASEKPLVEVPVATAEMTPKQLPKTTMAVAVTAAHKTNEDSIAGSRPDSGKGEMKTAGLQQNSEEKPAEEEKASVNATEALQITANEYSVGIFGGVSNLALTINNTSPKNIDKAIVEVNYLKPNGKVVQTQTVEVSGLGAGASRTVAVPNSSRGVKIRYHVVNL